MKPPGARLPRPFAVILVLLLLGTIISARAADPGNLELENALASSIAQLNARSAVEREGLRALYAAHEFAPLWFANAETNPMVRAALSELGASPAHGLSPSDYALPALEASVATIDAGDRSTALVELSPSEEWRYDNLLADAVRRFQVRHGLMGRGPAANDMRAWNADATRLPYRMHSEYLRRLYLNNDLAEGRYIVKGAPVALKDIRVPILAVATENDHVSPWKSVYKTHILTDADLEFILVSGGHNVGIVCPPQARVPAHFLAAARWRGDSYRDPTQWLQQAAAHTGSWWPYWQHWLARHTSGSVKARRLPAGALDKAPGFYVKER